MTEIGLIKGELYLAHGDDEAAERLAREIHQFRATAAVIRKLGVRRVPAVIWIAATTQPTARDIDPPAERGSSRDLLQAAHS